MMHDIDFVEINRTALRQLASLLARWLPTGKRQGHEFVALNPTRADNKPGSFSINMNTGEWADFATGDKGGDPISLLAYLRGTKQGEAAKELAIELGINEHSKTNGRAHEYRPPPPEKPQPFFDGHLIKRGFELVKEYDYTDEDSELLYQTLRYEHPTEKKEFLARRPDGRGEWLSGAGERRVLYRGNDLQRAVHNTVFVCEGEKDADRLADLDFVAVTVAFGTWNEDSIKALKGKETLVLEDNDVPGRKKAEDAAKALYGIAETVRIVALPGLADGEDVSDWLNQGGDAYRLVDLAKQAPLWEPKEARQEQEQPSSNTDGSVPIHWHGEADTAPLREWTVENMLPRRGTALMSGQWGTYKTFVALDLAAAVMTSAPFAGRKVNRQGGVLLIAVEGQDEVRVRLEAIIQDKIAPSLEAQEHGRTTVNPAMMPFAWVEACPQLTVADALPKLRSLVSDVAAGMQKRFGLSLALIKIDTLSPAAEFKDANDSAENQRVMTLLKTIALEFDLCVLPIDHFGKDVSTGTRNSSVKEAHADAVLALLGERDLAGRVSNPRLAIRKLRGGRTGEEIAFSTREVCVESQGQPHSTLVIDWSVQDEAAAPPKTGKLSKSLLIFKRALDVMMTDVGRKIRPFPNGPEVLAVDQEKVREEFYKTYLADNTNAKKVAFNRCGREAVDRGIIVAREIGNETFFWMKRPEDEPR